MKEEIEEAMEEYRSIINTLKNLGLSVYEARAFLALVATGVGSADIVAETARIPRTSAYKVLESLEEKGFVISTGGRPKFYKPEDLKTLRSRFVSQVNDLFDKLEVVEEILVERGEPQLVYTIYGRDKVMQKIAEMIDSAEKELIISTPKISEIRKNLSKNIERAIKRGVKIIVVTLPNQRTPEGVNVYRREGLIATDIVCDNKKALLAAPELNACGYTDNPALAQHLTHFINILVLKE